jgi:hypothetical protein
VRRYQNEDGTLTDAGRKRYGVLTERYNKAALNAKNTYSKASYMVSKANSRVSKADARLAKFNEKLSQNRPSGNHQQNNQPRPQNQQNNQNNQNNNQPKPQTQQPPQPKPVPQQKPQEISKNYWKKPVRKMNDAELKAYAERLATMQRIEGSIKSSTPVNSPEIKNKANDHKVRDYVVKKSKLAGDSLVNATIQGATKKMGNYFVYRMLDGKFEVPNEKKKN